MKNFAIVHVDYKRTNMGRNSTTAPEDVPPWAQGIRRAREGRGFTQEELSERIGVSNTTLSGWELGKHKPNIPKLEVIAEATGVDVARILAGGDPSGGEPNEGDALMRVFADAEKPHRHFVWTLIEVGRLFSEEGLEPDGAEFVSYLYHILAAAKDCSNDAEAKEAIARKLASERASFRANLKKVRREFLNPGSSELNG